MDRVRGLWTRFFEEATRPRCCTTCGMTRIWWNGTRCRSASGLIDGQVVTVASLPVKRVKCAACGISWALLPPGLLPGRHFDLAVVAEVLARYLFEEEASQQSVAEACQISPRTLGRFVDHTARVASPGLLQKLLLKVCGAPILARLEPVRDLLRKARSPARRLVLEEAGKVLCLLEALGAAFGLASPGLASLLGRVVQGRRGLTSYRSPFIPADAWCVAMGVSGSMSM